MPVILEVEHEILLFIAALEVSAAFALTHSSSLSRLSTITTFSVNMPCGLHNQSDKTVGGTLSETTEWLLQMSSELIL